jgi:prepilin peptidase CpaA
MEALLLAACLAALLHAAAHDVAARTIPHRTCLALAAAGLGLRLADGTLLPGLLAAFAALGLGFALWRAGFWGGGDAKLLAAAALAVPPAAVPGLILATALAGGLLALGYLAGPRLAPAPPPRPAGFLGRALRAEAWRLRRRGPLPYGVALALGAAFILLAPNPA